VKRRIVMASADYRDLSLRLAAGDAELSAQRQESAALRSQVAELRIANDNQNALLTGKLAILDYRIQSLLEAHGERQAGAAGGYGPYLDLLENALVGLLNDDPPHGPWSIGRFDADIRTIGRDWPQSAQTMIGTVRMRNIRHLLERVIADRI